MGERYHPYAVEDDRRNPKYSRSSNDRAIRSHRKTQNDPEFMEARRQMEKESHTLFVRNVPRDFPKKELEALFSKFGSVKDIFDMIASRGIAFVTFFDVRAADKARIEMHLFSIGNKQLDVHFSMPRDPKKAGIQNHGAIIVTVIDEYHQLCPLDMRLLWEMFSRYGEVRDVRHTWDNDRKYLVEYYDLRDSDQALKDSVDRKAFGGRMDAVFAQPTPGLSVDEWEAMNRRRSEPHREPEPRSYAPQPHSRPHDNIGPPPPHAAPYYPPGPPPHPHDSRDLAPYQGSYPVYEPETQPFEYVDRDRRPSSFASPVADPYLADRNRPTDIDPRQPVPRQPPVMDPRRPDPREYHPQIPGIMPSNEPPRTVTSTVPSSNQINNADPNSGKVQNLLGQLQTLAGLLQQGSPAVQGDSTQSLASIVQSLKQPGHEPEKTVKKQTTYSSQNHAQMPQQNTPVGLNALNEVQQLLKQAKGQGQQNYGVRRGQK